MPGFAVTSSIAASEGKASSAYVQGVGVSPALLVDAVKKTRVTSVVAVNKVGGILPFELFVRREVSGGVVDTYLVKNLRVLKRKHAVLSLVDQDPRVGADKMQDIPHTEVVLLPGDKLYARGPLALCFDVTVTLSEGIS